jgi:hypothetical protein
MRFRNAGPNLRGYRSIEQRRLTPVETEEELRQLTKAGEGIQTLIAATSSKSRFRYPLHTNLPHEHGTVSAGFFFSNGCRQIGQFLRRINKSVFLAQWDC